MKLSIVIVSYNNAQDVEQCLKSIAAYGDIGTRTHEVILVKNSPETVVVPASLSATTRVIQNQNNLGFGQAANLGVARATGEWVLLLNPDARLFASSLLNAEIFLTAHPKADIVGMQQFDGDQPIATFGNYPSFWREVAALCGISRVLPVGRLVRPRALLRRHYQTAGKRSWVGGGAMLIRRTTFLKHGGFDPNYFMYVEDIDLCRRIVATGGEVWYDPTSAVAHAERSSSSRKRAQELTAQSLEYYASKHGLAVFAIGAVQRLKARLS
jgi:GT2 family glycosyltransferase